MGETLQLWLDPDQFAAVAARIEAERQAARELDARVLAEWAAAEEAAELQIAA